MLPRDQIASGVWTLLEESYLDAASGLVRSEYAKLEDAEKWTTLLDYARTQAIQSKRWAEIVRDLQFIDLGGWNAIAVRQPAENAHA
jgi:hypothetical protein